MGMFEDSRNVGGDKAFIFTLSYDKRAALANGVKLVFMLSENNSESICALYVVHGF